MTDTKGGAAFQHDNYIKHDAGDVMIYRHSGMTLRDWFAGQALAGLLSSGGSASWEQDAANAYQAADAMIQARGTE